MNDGTTDEDGVRWRVPSAALAGTAANPDTRAAAATDGPPAPDPRRAAADAAVLDAARARAQALARRPAARAASDGLPERGDADGAAGRDGFERAVGADARRDASELGRDAAALVGTAVHAVLSERVETGADDAAWDRAATFVGARASSREARAALERLDDLRRALEAGPLLARLDAARADAAGEGPWAEIPVLLATEPEDDDALAPTSHYSGAIDLVLRDAEGWAVIDFKTDRLADDAARDAAAAHYRPQLARYARALERALALDAPPRRELWWLERGEVTVFED